MSNWSLESDYGTLEFGDDIYGIALAGHPDFTVETDTQDASLPRTDGVVMGEDFVTGVSVTLPVTIRGHDEAEVAALRDEFARFWRGDRTRKAVGRTVTLVSASGRRLVGRTRRFLVDDSSTKFGLCRITASFSAVTPDWQGDAVTTPSEPLGTVSAGVTAPVTAPVTTVGEGTSRAEFTVGGTADAPLQLTFTGPAVNPRVAIGDHVVSLATSLAWDERITLDARPWVREITRWWTTSDRRAPAAGTVTAHSTPLSELALEPGEYEIVYTASSHSGDAGVLLTHAAAYSSY